MLHGEGMALAVPFLAPPLAVFTNKYFVCKFPQGLCLATILSCISPCLSAC
jgi:hypothetical protein